MIAIDRGKLIRVMDLPSRLPLNRKGVPISYSAIDRWVRIGRRGRRLETVKIGGILYTDEGALNRFFATEVHSR